MLFFACERLGAAQKQLRTFRLAHLAAGFVVRCLHTRDGVGASLTPRRRPKLLRRKI
jgi:hypothetical protein